MTEKIIKYAILKLRSTSYQKDTKSEKLPREWENVPLLISRIHVELLKSVSKRQLNRKKIGKTETKEEISMV